MLREIGVSTWQSDNSALFDAACGHQGARRDGVKGRASGGAVAHLHVGRRVAVLVERTQRAERAQVDDGHFRGRVG